jgi:hypothetical protein
LKKRLHAELKDKIKNPKTLKEFMELEEYEDDQTISLEAFK